eukprot:3506005-Ditylum_brightwellii.AAC.1
MNEDGNEPSAIQLNAASDIGSKSKALLIKLPALHGKDNINAFAKKRRQEIQERVNDSPHYRANTIWDIQKQDIQLVKDEQYLS